MGLGLSPDHPLDGNLGLDKLGCSAGVTAVAQVARSRSRRGATRGRTATADSIATGAERPERTLREVLESLGLEGIAKGNGSLDALGLVGAELAHGVVYEHGSLRVTGKDDLGVGALLNRLLDIGNHGLGTSTAGNLSGNTARVGSVVDTLDGDLVLAKLLLKSVAEARADDASHVSHLRSAASENESCRLASLVEAVRSRTAQGNTA